MSSKDYELIADVMAMTKPLLHEEKLLLFWELQCDEFANAMQRENDRFDRERFLRACGVTDDN